MANELVVVNGATLECTSGSASSTFTVSSSNAKADGEFVGVATDITVGTFGTCSVLSGPCTPTIVGPWLTPCIFAKLNAVGIIKDSSTLVCPVGGVVSVSDPGQTSVKAG